MPFFEGANEDALTFKPLPVTVDEGAPPHNIYRCQLETKYAVSKAGNDMVKVIATVLYPDEFAGRKIFDNLLFSQEKFKNGGSHFDKTFHVLKQLLGEDWVYSLDGSLEFDIIPNIVSTLEGLVCGVQVGQREEEYMGKKQVKNVVREYYTDEEYDNDLPF